MKKNAGQSSKTSGVARYFEELMFNPKAKEPLFEVNEIGDCGRRRCFVQLTADGIIISSYRYSKIDDTARLRRDDALKLRDWITEMLEG